MKKRPLCAICIFFLVNFIWHGVCIVNNLFWKFFIQIVTSNYCFNFGFNFVWCTQHFNNLPNWIFLVGIVIYFNNNLIAVLSI